MNILDRKDEIADALRRDIHLAEWLEQDFRNGIPVDELRDATDLIEAQAERIAELEALVDAAKRDFRKIADGDRTWMCPLCAHCLGTESGIAKCEFPYQCQRPSTLFEWRGTERDG